jgi:hypothetical protein
VRYNENTVPYKRVFDNLIFSGESPLVHALQYLLKRDLRFYLLSASSWV